MNLETIGEDENPLSENAKPVEKEKSKSKTKMARKGTFALKR